jgi:hypothetical protein
MNETERQPKFKVGDKIIAFVDEPAMKAEFTVSEIKKVNHIPENEDDDGFHFEYGYITGFTRSIGKYKLTVTEEDIVEFGKVVT